MVGVSGSKIVGNNERWVLLNSTRDEKRKRFWERRGARVCCSAASAGEVGCVGEEEKVGYLVTGYGWGMRRMVEDGGEMRRVAFVQAEAFHVPVALFDDFFFQFFQKGKEFFPNPFLCIYVGNSLDNGSQGSFLCWAVFTMMKSANFYGVRGKQLLLTLTVVICTTILIWAWERTPLLPSQEHFDVLRPETPNTDQSKNGNLQPYKEEGLSNIATVETRKEKAEQVPVVAPMGPTGHGKEDKDVVLASVEKKECNC